MPIRHGNAYRALGWLVVVCLYFGPALAQQNVEEPSVPVIQDKGIAVEAPAAEETVPSAVVENDDTGSGNSEAGTQNETEPTQEPAPKTAPPINSPISSPPADVETKQRNRYPNCEFNDIRECDLAAQQSMAESTSWMNRAAWVGITLTVLGLFLLWRTMRYTRDAASYTRDAVDEAKAATQAAQVAGEQAQRQADAAILLEAAKIVFSRAILAPVGGGMVFGEGIPEDGLTPCVTMKNIGKTRAFILRTCIVLTVSNVPPERRYPMASQIPWLVAPGVPANEKFDVRDRTLTVSLTEQQRGEIQAGREHIWLLVCVWFKDWFDIERCEEFLLRWKPGPEPGEPPGVRTGFITHDDAQ